MKTEDGSMIPTKIPANSANIENIINETAMDTERTMYSPVMSKSMVGQLVVINEFFSFTKEFVFFLFDFRINNRRNHKNNKTFNRKSSNNQL